ncbi:hypothetical protein JYK14_14325 [Siccirubricoccus sp. KC 17139]|uniref:Uncharacterized protein n=1 Tax=Siccirubricoccus soli TaxID=2899147 RepID=A0ABT1D6W5_9PROT|nr:hypothetical protein [Siccirubricoccus soli]MCO6417332.1 hypothetical protein [Siccirubricoccus soli]MCP2683467.1 hypothetical protein [Siccirubricoccus soli]
MFLLLLLGAVPSPAQDLTPFFVQAGCADAAGRLRPGTLPFEPGCDRKLPLAAGQPLPYRKHDWPAAYEAAAWPHGYQASDSLLGRLRGRPAALQSFDFADATRAFARLDPGDGGQAVILGPGGAWVALTEDGSGGRQWFQGPRCGRPALRGEPDPGWLLALPPLQEGWQQRVVRLGISAAPEACPAALGPSLTRWRLLRLELPWREAGGAPQRVPAEALLSEHYGGASLAAADHLERFWFVRDLGLVRWERWETPARSRALRVAAMAELLTTSGRCPPMAGAEPPAPGWQAVDCRLWTNIRRAGAEAPLSGLGWR